MKKFFGSIKENYQVIIIAGIFVGVFLLAIFGNEPIDYETESDKAYRRGYDAGYEEGQDEIYDERFFEGVDIGYDDGYSEGYDEGYKTAYRKAYKAAMQKGYKTGWNDAGDEYEIIDFEYDRERPSFLYNWLTP